MLLLARGGAKRRKLRLAKVEAARRDFRQIRPILVIHLRRTEVFLFDIKLLQPALHWACVLNPAPLKDAVCISNPLHPMLKILR